MASLADPLDLARGALRSAVATLRPNGCASLTPCRGSR